MVLIVIKTYTYMIYVEIFVTVNCGAEQDNGHHSKPKRETYIDIEFEVRFGLSKRNTMRILYIFC